jgi:hypothetical protein
MALTLRRLAEMSGPDAVAKYSRPGQTDTSPVVLECDSCYQIDTSYPGVDPTALDNDHQQTWSPRSGTRFWTSFGRWA